MTGEEEISAAWAPVTGRTGSNEYASAADPSDTTTSNSSTPAPVNYIYHYH